MATPLRRPTPPPDFEPREKRDHLRVIDQPTTIPYPQTEVDIPTRQAYDVLKFGFTALPIIAGVDKFSRILVNWDDYLAPVIPNLLGISTHNIMMGVGIIEVVAGIGVAIMPRVFAYIVSAWMAGIMMNLLLAGPNFYDIALRDFGLSLGAFALGRLSEHVATRSSSRDLNTF